MTLSALELQTAMNQSIITGRCFHCNPSIDTVCPFYSYATKLKKLAGEEQFSTYGWIVSAYNKATTLLEHYL